MPMTQIHIFPIWIPNGILYVLAGNDCGKAPGSACKSLFNSKEICSTIGVLCKRDFQTIFRSVGYDGKVSLTI